jgi:hypothetical protein
MVFNAHLCNHILLRGGGTWGTALYTVKSPESEKTRTHPAQAFTQLFGPFSYKYWV